MLSEGRGERPLCGRWAAGQDSDSAQGSRPAESLGEAPAQPMALHPARCHIHQSAASGTRCRLCEEITALRTYRCARCDQTVLICSRCDRGHLYCAAGCAALCQRESLRRAGAQYQKTQRGRRKHAARQALYRRRQKQKVTHQGPPQADAFVQRSWAQDNKLAQEEKDVPKRSVSELPAAPVCSMEAQAAPAAAPPPAHKEAPPRGAASQHVCHFCGHAKSPYLRREPVFKLRRRHLRLVR